MAFISKAELVYLLYHLPVAMSSPFISWYFFKLSGGDYWGAGLIISIPYIFFIFSTTLFGRISDIIGSKKVILLALFSQLISFIVYYNISDPWIFFFSYIFFNVLISAFNPAYNRYVSFNVNIDQGEVFGRLGSWASVGFFSGSLLTAILLGSNGEDFRPLFLIAALLASVTLLSVLTLIEETSSNLEETMDHSTRKIPPFKAIKPLLVILVLVLLTQTSNQLYVGFFAIFIENELGQNVNWVAIINSTATIIGIAATYLIGKLLVRKYPKKHIINIGLLIYFILPFFTFIFHNEALIVFSLYSIPTYAVFFVIAPVFIAENTTEENRGFSMGLHSAFMFCGQALGTLGGAYFASVLNVIRYNFLVAAVLAFISIIMGILFFADTISLDP